MRDIRRKVMHSAFFLLCILLLASCGNNPNGTTAEDVAKVGTDKANVAGSDDTIEKLLKVYDGQGRTDQPATADKIFDLLFREEMTDERITVGSSTPSDSIDMLVWYWAGEHLWTTQDYDEGLYYAEKALPLTYKLGDLSLQSYCERLVGLFYFRRSNYYNAIEHVSKSLELSKKGGDKSQVGSSLNTLAGICLAAKQLNFLAKGTVMMDFVPDYINKVVGNLLSNAFKFTPEYGKISVAAWREGDRLLIEVSDTGKGMDKKTLTHIFEPFYQAEDESQQFGTGLGLALVKQIMDAVAGRVSVESKLGSGTTFHLSFPINNKIKKAVGETATLDTALLPDNPAALADSEDTDDRCRLLIIEDNRDIAAYIGAQFADSYAISYAANGDEGLEKAQQLVPDLIITDLMMPGMDGLELCRKVRSNDIINHIPIIVVTARITEEERIRGLEAGADAYLTKPFNEDELRTRVDKLLEGRRLLQQKYAQTATERTDDRQTVSQPVSADLRFLTKVSDVVYMQISRNKSFDVALIASILCMSSRQFHRKMVAITGCTPTAYIQRIKIKKAKTLLDNNPHLTSSLKKVLFYIVLINK